MDGGIELLKPEQRSPLQLLWHNRTSMFGRSPVEDIFCATVAKGPDHANTITRISCYFNHPPGAA